MNETLKRLFDGIAAVKDETILLAQPSGAVGKGETVIAELTDPDLQKFFIFHCQCSDAFDKRLNEIIAWEEAHPAPAGKEHNMFTCPNCRNGCEASAERDFVEAVRRLFWAAVEGSLSTESKIKYISSRKSLGIRKGWKVVMLQDMPEVREEILIMEVSGPVLTFPFSGFFRQLMRRR